MGTRALIHIRNDADDAILCTIYRQYDGYPSELGKDICNALAGREMVNGYNDAAKQVNGMGCAAALLIANLKSDFTAGNVYVYPAGSADVGEEYTYTLALDAKGKLAIVVSDYERQIYKGTLAAMARKLAKSRDALD